MKRILLLFVISSLAIGSYEGWSFSAPVFESSTDISTYPQQGDIFFDREDSSS